jgi:hypothetical protein
LLFPLFPAEVEGVVGADGACKSLVEIGKEAKGAEFVSALYTMCCTVGGGIPVLMETLMIGLLGVWMLIPFWTDCARRPGMIILLVRDIQIGFELVCCCEPLLSLTASIMAIPSDRPLVGARYPRWPIHAGRRQTPQSMCSSCH